MTPSCKGLGADLVDKTNHAQIKDLHMLGPQLTLTPT